MLRRVGPADARATSAAWQVLLLNAEDDFVCPAALAQPQVVEEQPGALLLIARSVSDIDRTEEVVEEPWRSRGRAVERSLGGKTGRAAEPSACAASQGHAVMLQRQLVDALRSPSVLSRVAPESARGPPKTALPSLEGTYRPLTARTPPPASALLRPASPRA